MKLRVLSIAWLICGYLQPALAQSGIYIGKIHSSTSYVPQGKLWRKQDSFENKTLQLNTDGSFSYRYEYQVWTSMGREVQQCTGTWHRSDDTLTLTSSYAMPDFFRVTETFEPSTEQDLVKIHIRSSCERKLYQVSLAVNSKNIGSYNDNDTVFTRCPQLDSIGLYMQHPGFLQGTYRPSAARSNRFYFEITPQIKGNNIYFRNYRLLVSGNELKPLERGGSLYVDKNYRKQR